MRDFKFLVAEEQGLDIDIVAGQAVYLDYSDQTSDQRAAVACYLTKGTLPGNLDLGISWAEEFSNENTMMTLNNELQQAVQSMAGSADAEQSNTANSYSAQLLVNEGETGVVIMRG